MDTLTPGGKQFQNERNEEKKTRSRIYVCHTYYHVYVAVLKEMKLARDLQLENIKKRNIARELHFHGL